MHINYFRGETRTLVWRRRSQPSRNHGHPNPNLEHKIRRAKCDLEVPRHYRGTRKRPWLVRIHYRGGVSYPLRRYETEERAREGIRAMDSLWWGRTTMTVEYKP